MTSPDNNKQIDLRSDTVTLPAPAMKDAMMSASLGDDVYGEDATVNELQGFAADLFAKDAALFFPSGTQSNLTALLAHCQRGEEVIVGRSYHVYQHEAHGSSVLGGLALYPLEVDSSGAYTLEALEASIKANDFHYAISKLLSLENTVSGHVQPLKHIQQLSEFAHSKGLSVHMDGARIFNAHVHSQIALDELTRSCDSVSICLSKGLGAPAGSLLLGGQEFIQRATRLRKMLGGGMRQAGVLAAAGLYALQHNVDRLQTDHRRAKHLAGALSEIAEISVSYADTQSNMVFVNIPEQYRRELQSYLQARNILMESPYDHTRLVCHLNMTDADVEHVIDAFKTFFSVSSEMTVERDSAR